MSNVSSNEETVPAENSESLNRRLFLRSVGKWSGAAIVAAVVGCVVYSQGERAGVWVNRRGIVRGGGWINGGGWVNRAGGWINGRWGGGGWINRRGWGGGGWINRW